MFPSPLEVYRFISNTNTINLGLIAVFPSPLEVDRFISQDNTIIDMMNDPVSVPS